MRRSPQPISREHFHAILANNLRFEHWLAPLDPNGLLALLEQADYARQLRDGQAVLIGYSGQGSYRHSHVDYLSARLDNYAYIDRVIVGGAAQGEGLATRLYDDFTEFARERGFDHVACEVNTRPDNPHSHGFHRAYGFESIGEVECGRDKSVRYYVLRL